MNEIRRRNYAPRKASNGYKAYRRIEKAHVQRRECNDKEQVHKSFFYLNLRLKTKKTKNFKSF